MKNLSVFLFLAFLLIQNTNCDAQANDSASITSQVRKVIVLPFNNKGESNDDWIARGLIYLVNNKIAVISGLYSADDQTVEQALNQLAFKSGILTDRQASQLGKLTKAEISVSGSFNNDGEKINFSIYYHNNTNGQQIYNENMIAYPRALPKVADKIIFQLLQLTGLSKDIDTDNIDNSTLTNNENAFENFIKAYIEAEKKPADVDNAISYFEKAIKEDNRFWEAYYNLGVLYFNQRNFEKAAELFDKLIQSTPRFYKSYYGRALIYENQNDYSNAIINFKKVVELNPNDYMSYIWLAKLSRLTNNFGDAQKYLDQARTLSADYAPLYNEAGNLLVAQGKPKEAIDEYRKAVDLDPGNINFHQGLGEAYYRARVYYNALYEFESILKLHPDDPDANFMMGITIYKQAVLEEIIEAFLDILNETGEKPENNPPRFPRKLKPDSIKQQKIYNQMEEAFGKAVEGRPDFMQANFNLALTCLEKGSYDKAEKYFLRTQEINPDLIQAYTKLAEVYEKTNRLPLAIEQYKKTFYIEPSIYIKKPTLGPVHHYINVLDPFMDDLDKRIKNNPDDIQANLTLAKVNIAEGDNASAITILKKIISLKPNNNEAKVLLASIKK